MSLRDAVALSDDVDSEQEFRRKRSKYTAEDLLEVCHNMLIVKNADGTDEFSGSSTIEPIHYSVQEIFTKLRDDSTSKLNEQVLCDFQANHAMIAKVCLKYLKLGCLEQGPAISFNELSNRLAQDKTPFAWYSALYFDEHLSESSSVTSDLQELLTEVFSMPNRMNAALLQLRKLRSPKIRSDFRKFHQHTSPLLVMFSTKVIHMRDAYKIMEHLFQTGTDPNIPNQNGETPLYLAVQSLHVRFSELLLSFGTQTDEQTLNYVSQRGSPGFVSVFLRHRLFNEQYISETLLKAIHSNPPEVAKLLLAHGVLPRDGMLLKACQNGFIELIQILMDRGVDPNMKTEDSVSYPLCSAAWYGRKTIVELLISRGVAIGSSSDEYGTPLIVASCRGHYEVVVILLRAGANVNAIGSKLGTALAAAACCGDRQIVECLLNSGADVNLCGKRCRSPLQQAAINRSAEDKYFTRFPRRSRLPDVILAFPRKGETTIYLLLDAGAHVNAEGPYGTALEIASTRGRLDAITLLLNSGANINLVGPRGSALQRAILSSRFDAVKLLLDRGAKLEIGSGTLGDAIRDVMIGAEDALCRRVVGMLLDSGMDIETRLNSQRSYKKYENVTMLQLAAHWWKPETLKYLLSRGANVHAVAGTLGEALEAAFSFLYYRSRANYGVGNLEATVKILLGAGAHMPIERHVRSTLLEVTATIGSTMIIETLITKGADVKVDGGLALIRATEHGHQDVAQLLIARGVDLSQYGGNVLKRAAQRDDKTFIKLLIDAGVNANAKGENIEDYG